MHSFDSKDRLPLQRQDLKASNGGAKKIKPQSPIDQNDPRGKTLLSEVKLQIVPDPLEREEKSRGSSLIHFK